MTVEKCVVLGGSDNRQAYGVEGDPVRLKRIAFALSIVLGKCAEWQTALRLSNSPLTSKWRNLLQSVNVRPMLDADGKETGMFVPAGGPDTRALELLVTQQDSRGQCSKAMRGSAFPLDLDKSAIPATDPVRQNLRRCPSSGGRARVPRQSRGPPGAPPSSPREIRYFPRYSAVRNKSGFLARPVW